MNHFNWKRAGMEFLFGVASIAIIVLMMSLSWIVYLAWVGVFK